MTTRIPWLRIFAEGIAIVVSILLAFGIQAWWEGRQDDLEARRILIALARDFAATREDLISNTNITLDQAESGSQFLRLLSTDRSGLDAAEMIRHLNRAFVVATYEPRLSTYEEVIGSGDLGLIGSDTLRVQMALAVGLIEAVEASQDQLYLRYLMGEEPYLIEHLILPEMVRLDNGSNVPSIPNDFDPSTLLDPELASIVQAHLWSVSSLEFQVNNAVARIDRVLQHIEAELQR